MTATVRVMDRMIMISGLSHPEKVIFVQAPMKAPAIVMMSFPKKNAVKNFAGLYFIKPSGITMGSSGMGEAAAAKSKRNAHYLTFDASVLSRS